jgi:hypothetical protein
MKRLTIRRLGLLLLGTGLAIAPLIAEAGGRAPRGGGGGGGGGAKVTRPATRSAAPAPRATGTSAARATAPRGGKQTAHGTATYGYYHGGYGYYPGYWPGYYPPGYYPGYWDPWYWDYWAPGWSVGVTFGWPYFSYGAYYAPYAYPYDYAAEPPPVEVGPAAIEIDVKPSSARVIWNGEDVGRAKDYNGSWDRLRVSSGRQWLELKADGYKTLRVAVDARSGGYYRLDYALEKGEGIDPRSQDPAALPPPRAEVASAPAPAPDDAGPSARLEKGFLRLAVMPPDAAVYLDGEYFARADELARLRGAIPLAVGEHRVDVVRPGYAARSLTVTVDRGATATTTVDLAKTE